MIERRAFRVYADNVVVGIEPSNELPSKKSTKLFSLLATLVQSFEQTTMLPPVICLSCNCRTGNLWLKYTKMIDGRCTPEHALDELGLERICCRRMMLTSVELNSGFVEHENAIQRLVNMTVERNATMKRTVPCN